LKRQQQQINDYFKQIKNTLYSMLNVLYARLLSLLKLAH